MKALIRLLAGLGLRVEVELVQRRTVDVVIDGIAWPAPRQLAQAITRALEQSRAEITEITAITATAAEGIDAACAREAEAVERAERAEARAKSLEAQLAARVASEREALEAARVEGYAAGVEIRQAIEDGAVKRALEAMPAAGNA
jgi:hypothetical protein